MKKLTLKRIFKNNQYTIGHLYIDGEYFSDCIEDKVRDLPNEPKVYAKTAIPGGKYKIKMTYSPKFKRVLPELLDVPYFTSIRIHRGNTERDSAGCLILGKNTEIGKVTNSTYYEKQLCKILKDENDIEIEILD